MTHPSAAYARELVAALAANGMRDYVLCPGSRSGPLAHALAEAASKDRPTGAPEITLHVRIDERSAAFLALGIARAGQLEGKLRPVGIVTTSGTAVGNLLPAVMEAHHAGLPLMLLTADRPRELRGIGANQTTDQEGIFGAFVRWEATSAAPEEGEREGRATLLAARAVHWAIGKPDRDVTAAAPGPVHLNVEFREPLGPDGGAWPAVDRERATLVDRTRQRLMGAINPRGGKLPDEPRTVVIAGDGAGDRARLVAEAHNWPLLAEPTSGARTGPNALPCYAAALRTDAGQALAAQVRQVVVVGRPTLSRPIQQLIDRAPALYVAGHGARWREAPRHAERVVHAVPDEWLQLGKRDSEWVRAWGQACEAVPGVGREWGPRTVARVVVEELGSDDVALIGSSGPIRMVDDIAPVWEPGTAPTLVANRGLSGIDGTTSTAIGIALALGKPVTALMGDVTFLHDAGGLLVGTDEVRPNVRIVVVNDGGGTIFASLEHSSANPENLRRVFTTPHDADLNAIAKAYGASYTLVESKSDLKKALTRPLTGIDVVEARVIAPRDLGFVGV